MYHYFSALLFHIFSLTLLLSTAFCHAYAVENTLNIPQARSSFDISHSYHKELLLKALHTNQENEQVTLIESALPMSQGRAIAELKNKSLDIYWLGTSNFLEKELIPIKVPTTRGLIGFRKFIIHKDSLKNFTKVKSINELKKFSACQGTHWPDTEILRSASLTVITTPIYEDLFKMLNAKRCDYFPRGYHDITTELTLRKNLYPDLISLDNILLHYPFAVYFFTHKNNKKLADKIELGLQRMAQNGEIEALMKKHPLTANTFPLSAEQHDVLLELNNSLLPSNTNFLDSTYWILPRDFDQSTSHH